MLDRDRAEALFLEHLGWINRVAAIACAKYGLRGAEAEDFISWIQMKVIEDDYAVLNRYRGESTIRTYLATVVARNLVDYLREREGQWRSSAAARRFGPPAGELERLVYRDGYTVQQAGEKLRTSRRTTLSDAELVQLLAYLPVRSPLRPVVEPQSDGVLNATASDSRADERVVAAELESRRVGVMTALDKALGELESEEQLIVRLYFGEGLSLASVARTLQLEQKPLYRRVERLRTRLRALLEGAGLREEDVQDLLLEPESP